MTSSLYIGISVKRKAKTLTKYYQIERLDAGFALRTWDHEEECEVIHHVRKRSSGHLFCDCKDTTYRGRYCKHCQAIREQIDTGLLKEIA